MKKSARPIIAFSTVVALACLSLVGCRGPDLPKEDSSGSLRITIGSDGMKSIVPPISMDIAYYAISGAGPGGAAFSSSNVTASTYTKAGLAVGTWAITVDGFNSTGDKIGSGNNPNVRIVAGGTAYETIKVVPIEGNGYLSFTITYASGSIASPRVSATMTPQGGSASSISFSAGSSSAAYSGTWPEGYYTLEWKLYDGSSLLIGKSDAVRIVAGQTSSGTYAYTPASSTGGISVTITNGMENPISISFSGKRASIALGSDMNVTATCAPSPDRFQWYLNGDALSGRTSSSIAIGSSLAAGTYALDLLVFKDSIISSEGFTFTVGGSSGINEDFSDGVADNFVPSDSKWSVTGGVYRMAGQGAGAFASSYYSETFDDFAYSADITVTGSYTSSAKGLYIRSDGSPMQNSYGFCISNEIASFWVGTFVAGSQSWTGWLDSSAILTGSGSVNHLSIAASGSTMVFSINGTVVHTLVDSSFVSGKVGLCAYDANANTIVDFDNVNLVPGSQASTLSPFLAPTGSSSGLRPVVAEDTPWQAP
jgi:hypothetical protein